MRFIINTILFGTALTVLICHRDFTDYHCILAALFLMAQYVVIAGSLEFGVLTTKKKRLKKIITLALPNVPPVPETCLAAKSAKRSPKTNDLPPLLRPLSRRT